MGDHIDYLGGLVLPFALSQGTKVVMEWMDGGTHRATSVSHGQAHWPVGQPPPPSGQWFDYCAGALADLKQAVRIEIFSDLPQGAGLSSSASLLVALITARNELNQEGLSPLEVARQAHRVEVEYIGLRGGIMNPYVSAMGEAGLGMMLDCQAMVHYPVRFGLGDAQLWAVDSLLSCASAEDVSHQRIQECSEIQTLMGSDHFFTMSSNLPEPLVARLRHIQSEQVRVKRTANAASQGDLKTWGALMNESHQSLSQDYEVAGEALDTLQSALTMTPGCFGARMTGGGFGGCVIALIDRAAVGEARAAVAQNYGETRWIECSPSAGARLL